MFVKTAVLRRKWVKRTRSFAGREEIKQRKEQAN